MKEDIKNQEKQASSPSVQINWYPGHMAKANRQMEEELRLVDIVIELRDARAPLASFNPKFEKMFNGKPRLIILNKADLADSKQNELWLNHFGNENTLLVNSTHDDLKKIIVDKVQFILKDKIAKARARGIRNKTLRAMVVGIPNVGKSTFINNIVKKKVNKVENRPGVTKSLTWININQDLSLLDTPGVLWPKFEDQIQATILALLGSINDDILDKVHLTNFGLDYIKKEYPGLLKQRYSVLEDEEDILNAIGKQKGWLISGGDVDISRACDLILKDIRNNNIGRISYEKCH